MRYFKDSDLAEFWKDSDYSRQEYVLPPPTDITVAATERSLGYKLPGSYIELMRHQNGGLPEKTSFPTAEPTSWAGDHVAINGLLGIGDSKSNSLCGEFGSQFMIEEWGYPRIGIYFGDCPSAGHDMICLDYRDCGPRGQPRVVHVDQEFDYKITFLADSFEGFVKGLVSDEHFDSDDRADESDAGFVWRTKAITATIVQMTDGQHLYLEQQLTSGESGWTMMRIDIPGHWEVRNTTVAQDTVRLDTAASGSYELSTDNVGKLSFEILDGGRKSDDALESIWIEFAATKA